MRMIIAAIALVLACAQAHAVAGGKIGAGRNIAIDGDCSVHSDYAFHLTERSVIFTRDDDSRDAAPSRVLMRQGRLFVDDGWVKLTPKDSERVRTYERQARSAMPLAQQIGRDAAPRAKALERNVDLLCLRMESLERIGDALEYRLPDGSTLDLLQVQGQDQDKRDRS